MKIKEKGLTLIEAIISMWIFAIVVLSVVVCIAGMNSKISQRKLQALNIARSEVERVRYKIMSGAMNMNGGTDRKNYSRLFEVVEKRVVKVDSKGNLINYTQKNKVAPRTKETYSEVYFYAKDKDANHVIDVNEADDMTGTNQGQIPVAFNGGDAVNIIKNLTATQAQFLSIKDQIDYREDEGEGLFTLYKGFVMDVKINKDPSNGNIYNVLVKVGWFEQGAQGAQGTQGAKNRWMMRSAELQSQVYSELHLN